MVKIDQVEVEVVSLCNIRVRMAVDALFRVKHTCFLRILSQSGMKNFGVVDAVAICASSGIEVIPFKYGLSVPGIYIFFIGVAANALGNDLLFKIILVCRGKFVDIVVTIPAFEV